MKDLQVLIGDCKETLRQLPDKSVHTCITSPPYYGLRDYGTAEWEGGDPDCEHSISHFTDPKKPNVDRPSRKPEDRKVCNKCGAIRTDSQIGLEDTPEEFIENLVEVFREVKRVLRDDGTLWLNLGDTYWGGKGASGQISADKQEARTNTISTKHSHVGGSKQTRPTDRTHGIIKPKDLIGIPWMVALALRADGWYLRQDIIWQKPNPMPESVKDRCTKAHEYIFLLSKSKKYYYDHEAVKQRTQDTVQGKRGQTTFRNKTESMLKDRTWEHHYSVFGKRNRHSVWKVPVRPFKEAHFAVYPPELIEPCILAGTSAKGCCSECGEPYKRLIETKRPPTRQVNARDVPGQERHGSLGVERFDEPIKTTTIGWELSCDCNADIVPCTVLDPFGGSGTTAAVALKHQRQAILCELNEDYVDIQPLRIEKISGRVEGQQTLF